MRLSGRGFHLIFWPGMLAYCFAGCAISGWFGWQPPKAGLGLYLAAVSPALPVGIVIFAMGRCVVGGVDEFVRMIQVKAMLIGTGLTMFTCTALGFLAQHAHVWAPSLYLVFPMWCAFWGVSLPVVIWRYR